MHQLMSRKVLWHTGAASQSEFDGGSRPSFDGFDDIISISSESSGSVLEISNDIENSECIVIEFLLDNLNRFTVTVINVSFAFLFLLAHIGNGSLGVDENASVSTKSSGSVRSVAVHNWLERMLPLIWTHHAVQHAPLVCHHVVALICYRKTMKISMNSLTWPPNNSRIESTLNEMFIVIEFLLDNLNCYQCFICSSLSFGIHRQCL